MPMSESLQNILSNPDIALDELDSLLQQEGINTRESTSLDTPLILATRYNNLNAVQHILETIQHSPDKNSILNAANKFNESALSAALNTPTDKKIALRLIQAGADLENNINPDLPEDALHLRNMFLEYHHLQQIENLTQEDLTKRGEYAFEIGHRYYNELSDEKTAVDWIEQAARDGHLDAILTMADYNKNIGNYVRAIEWYTSNYSLFTNPQHHNEILEQLKAILNLAEGNDEAIYLANMALGSISIGQGNIVEGMQYFHNAEIIHKSLENVNPADALFFMACSLWHGPSKENNTTLIDCLDYTKRFTLLIEANTPQSSALIIDTAKSAHAIILRLIACQICKDHGLLYPEEYQLLSETENQPYIEALSYLYGWNGKPKNLLRGANLLKKIIDSINGRDPETELHCHALIAFAYFMQENEKEIYILEALQHLDEAHACLNMMESPYREEIIYCILDGAEYINSEASHNYMQLLLDCFLREANRLALNYMNIFINKIIDFVIQTENPELLDQYTPVIAEQIMICYRDKRNTHLREQLLELLSHIKEKLHANTEAALPIEKALAECSEIAIKEVTEHTEMTHDDSKTVDAAVESFKTLAEHIDGDMKEVYIQKHADALILKAEAELQHGDYTAALTDFTTAYESSGSVHALCKMAYIKADSGEYDEALSLYRIFSANPEIQNHFDLLHSALISLYKMYEELPARSIKRNDISELMKELLFAALSGDTSIITSTATLEEFQHFSQAANEDPFITSKLNELKSQFVPPPSPAEQAEERSQYVEKLIESTKNSSARHIATLISLLDSERENEFTLPIVQDAVERWMESAVKVSADHVFIKDEKAIVQLAKRGNIAAAYYLARHLAQENKFQEALSVCIRIFMYTQQDNIEKTEVVTTIRELVRSFIYESANKPLVKGINKLFSKQEQIVNYANDLLEVTTHKMTGTNPDAVIEAILHEKPAGPDSSYNKYVLDISQIGLKDEAAKPLSAKDRRRWQDSEKN